MKNQEDTDINRQAIKMHLCLIEVPIKVTSVQFYESICTVCTSSSPTVARGAPWRIAQAKNWMIITRGDKQRKTAEGDRQGEREGRRMEEKKRREKKREGGAGA